MILKEVLKQIIEAQRENIKGHDLGYTRDALHKLPDLNTHALIVSGIRRCGKSTLLFQLLRETYNDAVYINFEDPRLFDFDLNDYVRLSELIDEYSFKVLMFDEIQIFPNWEKFVRGLLDRGYRIVITGSNASLLSKELGTKLTGRHITVELFPFSYVEFYNFKHLKSGKDSLLKYLKVGGFPEHVKQEKEEILQQLFEDILIRDIAVRYGIRDIKSLQRLAQYLMSNVGKFITANRLKSLFEISTAKTILEYLSYLESAYLFLFVSKFSYSIRKQLVNPRKVYAIDLGMVNVNSSSFSDDIGRKFENMVYLQLRRFFAEIYYFSEKGECDFLVFKKGVFLEAIQVCFQLTQDNLKRELAGLTEAMDFFKVKTGSIITIDQKDKILENSLVINVIPCYEWMEKFSKL